jgi:predicted CXXCH cytochrome family protein
MIFTVVLVFALTEDSHRFSKAECVICHIDIKNKPVLVKPDITVSCQKCHKDVGKERSHPTDIYPVINIPPDLPLIEGKLTCITCHYAHPEMQKNLSDSWMFLRRASRGAFFCSACHTINENKHIVFDNVHRGSYSEIIRSSRIDSMSLTCIECHDTYITEPVKYLGTGVWSHSVSRLNHPIGISYKRISMRNLRKFRPPSLLSRKIKLYNGKIGCGTCHDIYSKEKFKLVMSNKNSRLCLECHIK